MGVSSLSELSQYHLGELAAAAMAICATCSIVAWTSSSRHIGVMAVCFLRLLAASIFLAVWGRLAHGQWLPFNADGRAWSLLLISGFFGYLLSDLFSIKAFVVIGPRLTLLLQSIVPPMVTIIGYFYLGETIGKMNVLGIMVTLAGVVWVVLEQPKSRKEALPKEFTLGIILAVAGAILGGVGTIFARKGVGHLDPFAATQIRILAALVCYPPLLTLMRRWGQIGKAVQHIPSMKILLIGTLFGPILGMGLYMYALKVCASTGIVATITSTTPVLILPFSILLYKENVSSHATFGAGLSVIGVMLLMC